MLNVTGHTRTVVAEKDKELKELLLQMTKEEKVRKSQIWEVEVRTAESRAAAAKLEVETLQFRKDGAEAEREKLRYERDLALARYNTFNSQQ
jgi:hypothetical protein